MSRLQKHDYLKLALDQLIDTPVGEMLKKAVQILEGIWQHYAALYEKRDESVMTGIKAATLTVFAILSKVAGGKKLSDFEKSDWEDIAKAVSGIAILSDNRLYSVFVFSLYEKIIRSSAASISKIVSSKTCDAITALADELKEKNADLSAGSISEVKYTEDCLWISLEAMIKLLATPVGFLRRGDREEYAQALASCAFEYGRLWLYRKEQAIVDEFIASQQRMDSRLEARYSDYQQSLQAESESFFQLIDNAFVPDFRSAFLQSILLAEFAGVEKDEILKSEDDIDSYFMD